MGKSWKTISGGDHKRHPNGILGLLCRLHFPSFMEFGRNSESAYAWEHYVIAGDALDWDGWVFPNKAERVKGELWVSLPRTTLLNTSHSQEICEIMTGYIASICRIASDARGDMRPGWLLWLTKPPRKS